MKLPIIGISGDLSNTKFFLDFWTKRAGVNDAYIQSVSRSSGLPIMLPVTDNLNVSQLIASIDGLILTGGKDVSPALYGEDSLSLLRETKPERDAFEMALLKEAIIQNKPILGVCRGMQLINIAFGGTMLQDVSYDESIKIQHFQQTDSIFPIHNIKVKENSILHSILGSESRVNSIHHQAIKKLSPDFIATAWASDGVIEGIEKKGDEFILGVQWHPEMMSETDANMKKLFDRFIEACKRCM
ncbi:gamma-glutamyl-gamma-aminobutyrate hydrolase family protein [Clostridium cylindrosporum]|uniref:Putative glutamine amidotransferase n=1 Tax=Clostridium cylindrosporum DSM 605 TaxID=1121307 RepID=A0A0J8DE85_CLOCY|nr:gamma-glutamyl-gamma-aminobutyrate hydrolase family protein [Clostridium cylindrosporum]KMT22524.1 putative glutamine amidotransferase [Clostridium cylindrosporum DSM 605]